MKNYLLTLLFFCSLNFVLAENNQKKEINDFEDFLDCLNSEECKKTLKEKIENLPEKEVKQQYYALMLHLNLNLQELRKNSKEYAEARTQYEEAKAVIVEQCKSLELNIAAIDKYNKQSAQNIITFQKTFATITGAACVTSITCLVIALNAPDNFTKIAHLSLCGIWGVFGIGSATLVWRNWKSKNKVQDSPTQ